MRAISALSSAGVGYRLGLPRELQSYQMHPYTHLQHPQPHHPFSKSSGSWCQSRGGKVHVLEEANSLLPEVLKTFTILGPQQVDKYLGVLKFLNGIGFELVNAFSKGSYFSR